MFRCVYCCIVTAKILENTSLNASSCPNSMKTEMEDLRQQLQSMKKQTMTALEQARKSSDREQAALLRAQESLESEKTANAKATRSAERENYMLDLMSDASQDMAGTILFPPCPCSASSSHGFYSSS